MSEGNKNIELEKKFDQYWDESVTDSVNMEKSETIFNNISEELDFQDDSISLVSKYKELLKYAAIFIISISIAGYFIFSNNVLDKPKVNELKVAFNQQKLILEDNSQIELFSNSKLTYPSAFNSDTREVHLEGSALFTIAKDEKKPFLVYQGDLITKVLGTKFLIKEDSVSQLTKVYLHSGKIAITNKDNTVNRVLLPGDSLIYNKLTNKEFVEEAKLKEAIFIAAEKAIENKITIEFVNVKLKDAYKRIQKMTGIQIDNSNIGIEGELIISLEYKNKPVYRIINDLNSFSGFTYDIVDNIIIISK